MQIWIQNTKVDSIKLQNSILFKEQTATQMRIKIRLNPRLTMSSEGLAFIIMSANVMMSAIA